MSAEDRQQLLWYSHPLSLSVVARRWFFSCACNKTEECLLSWVGKSVSRRGSGIAPGEKLVANPSDEDQNGIAVTSQRH